MQLEVISSQKTEKATDNGIVSIYKVTLKGTEFADDVGIVAKLTLECENDPSALDAYVSKAIGDTRILTLTPVNRTLEEFQEAKK